MAANSHPTFNNNSKHSPNNKLFNLPSNMEVVAVEEAQLLSNQIIIKEQGTICPFLDNLKEAI